MALRRYTVSVDGSIPVQALLYDDEELLTSQDGVGIYDGLQKSSKHQNGTVSITTYRLFYVDVQKDVSNSFAMDLSCITQTEYYAGLFKSSPKVTCHLTGERPISGTDESEVGSDSWECEVCAYRNPPGLSPAAARICRLCGVPRSSITPIPTSLATTVTTPHLSSSLPSSSISLSASLAAESHSGRKQTEIACPACTFLNHHLLRECEMCDTELPVARGDLQSAPSSRPLTPDSDNDDSPRMIKLSFRKGGDKPFYTVLRSSLKGKAWETSHPSSKPSSSGVDNSTPGISGILRTVESTTQERENTLNSAFQDMEALMLKAKDMVKLAAELNEKLTAANTSKLNTHLTPAWSPHHSAEEPEEATFIRSSLSQLGLQMSNAPVTMDMMKDERKWLEELARELGRLLLGSWNSTSGGSGSGGIMKNRGIIALDEVWGGWNRVRGVALIPPATFLQVIPLLPTYTHPPIQDRSFPSGLKVLHTPLYTHTAFSSRLVGHLTTTGPKTTMEVAALEEDLPVGLVAEMIDAVEDDGQICRDDSGAAIVGGGSGSGSEIRWWADVFVGYSWDGQE